MAQLFSTPSSSRRKSKCCELVACFCTTKRRPMAASVADFVVSGRERGLRGGCGRGRGNGGHVAAFAFPAAQVFLHFVFHRPEPLAAAEAVGHESGESREGEECTGSHGRS